MDDDCIGDGVKCGMYMYQRGCTGSRCRAANAEKTARRRERLRAEANGNVVSIERKTKARSSNPRRPSASGTSSKPEQSGGANQSQASTSGEVGRHESAFITRCELAGVVDSEPDLYEVGRTLCQILDNSAKTHDHLKVTGDYLKVRAALFPERKKKSGGRLASVKAMTGNPHPAQQRKEA
ncbi:hypothetical protein [Mycobacterium scrofulaceum]|uniref:hypothetical protein n=1 Tax=Mycobacterium scrofulaceum TaxID=1783 RepID=UPI0012EACAC7|nr:hypothetical protein [Mycobacterium scrofulaceum]